NNQNIANVFRTCRHKVSYQQNKIGFHVSLFGQVKAMNIPFAFEATALLCAEPSLAMVSKEV
ncbi:hypothetical protein, partial [Candidatus Regiella insecticola]|uniref:hypothetical protein n=1 Tax=Candidatus Regiella insecticola TaxID=138073 RepID=UPI001ED9456A